MPIVIPPELKKVQAVVRRAEELDRDKANPESRLMAYYCRQYAVHSGIPLATSAAGKTCLGSLLEELEEEKPSMDQFTRDEAAFLCRKFATNIFEKADAEDRAGNANKGTAKTFYAASTFLQVLEQFYPSDIGEAAEDRAQDRKRILYAKWKSTEILKAIKEGRAPTPGGFDPEGDGIPVDDEEDKGPSKEEPSGVTPSAPGIPPVAPSMPPAAPAGIPPAAPSIPPAAPPAIPPAAPSAFPSVAPPVFPPPASEPESTPPVETVGDDADESQEVELGPPPAYGDALTFSLPPPIEKPLPPPRPAPAPAPVPPPAPAPSRGFGIRAAFSGKSSSAKPSKAQFADAVELTRFALAALEDKDADLAANRLQQALQCLGR